MKKFALAGFLAIAVAIAAAQGNAKDILKGINEYRTKELTALRNTGTPANLAAQNEAVAKVNAEVKSRAEAAIKGVDINKVDAKDAYDWAQVFALAERHEDVCQLVHRYLTTNPEPNEKFQAQMLQIRSCNELGEGNMLAATISSMKPTNAAGSSSLASWTVGRYVDTIAKTQSVKDAVATLSALENNLIFEDPSVAAKRMLENENRAGRNQDKPEAERLAAFQKTVIGQQASTRFSIVEKKAELLADSGQRSEAMKTLDAFINSLPSDSPALRGAKAGKARIGMMGAPAPSLNIERGYGDFKPLEQMKGKVVLLDFFAHWCGPCIAAFPDMRNMLADLKPKGLEILGVTTYYGYYARENAQARDMPKDTEFARMADFMKDKEMTWPVVYGDRSNFETYGITGIPHVVLVDKKGNVRKIHIGYSPQSFAELRKEIEKLLAE